MECLSSSEDIMLSVSGGEDIQEIAGVHGMPQTTDTKVHTSGYRPATTAGPHRCGIFCAVYAKVVVLVFAVALPSVELTSTKLGANEYTHSRTVLVILALVSIVYLATISIYHHRKPTDGCSSTIITSDYIKVATFVFSVGAMSIVIIEIVWDVHLLIQPACSGRGLLTFHVNLAIFIVLQTIVIFTPFKTVRGSLSCCFSRWAIAHLIATNLAAVFWGVFDQNLAESTYEHHMLPEDQQPCLPRPLQLHVEQTEKCAYEVSGGQAWLLAAPYLFPCKVQFHLLSALTMYVRWRHLRVARLRSSVPDQPRLASSRPVTHQSVQPDPMSGSLVSGHRRRPRVVAATIGVTTLALGVVSVIIMNVLYVDAVAYLVVCLIDIIFHLTALLTTSLGLLALRHPATKPAPSHYQTYIDSLLVAVSGGSVLLYRTFSLLAAIYVGASLDIYHQASVVADLLACLQATAQTLFILIYRRRSLTQPEDPARHVLTVLVPFNVAAALVLAFRHQKPSFVPHQKTMYGMLGWVIISKLCIPVNIFYRVFSAIVCIDIGRKLSPKTLRNMCKT